MAAQDSVDKVDQAAVRPDTDDMLRQWRRLIELELRVAAPARVIKYDPATQRADVMMEFLPVALGPDGDTEIPQPPVPIPGVPVRWPGGSLGYVTTPLVPGDTGHVVFTDRCLSTWSNSTGPVDPLSGRTHDLADAVFEPGLRQAATAITPPTDLTATVVEGPLVKLGRLATEFGLKGTTLASTCNTLFGVLNGVPNATDPATVITLANANKAAILGLLQAIAAAVSAKVQIE